MVEQVEQLDPPPSPPSRASPGTGSRHLVLLWCLWLLGSWGVALWRYNLAQAGQLMMLSIMAGLLLVWPAYRLSEGTRRDTSKDALSRSSGDSGDNSGGSSGGRVLMDWASLLIVCQAVFWPLQVVNHWPWYQAQWLNVSLAAWSFAAGLLIVWGSSGAKAWPRWVAMFLCIVLAGGGGLVTVGLWMGGWAALPNDIMSYGPLAGVWMMAGTPTFGQQHQWMAQTILVAAVAAMGWSGVALIRLSIDNGSA